jgi:predicted enzyme related to lactoylglutathione lyase
MQDRESYPPGVPCWLDTMQPDPEAAKEFYGGLFGWEFDNRTPQGSPEPYYVAQLRGCDVAAIGGPSESGALPTWNPYTAVESVERAVTRVGDAGGSVIAEPMDIPGAGRMAVFADPEGAVFSVWEAGAFIGAQLVNEPGTWNFSELNTRDPEIAARFYRDVFGWESFKFEMGDSAYTFFTLAGYGDFLGKSNPRVREAIEAGGDFAKFTNAVATLIDRSSEQDATAPSHWSVTFAVDDADAIAANAERLGGKVIVPPFDVEPVRMTVLADPQGAVFAASKFQPRQES